jgi:hypothetical protein
MPASKESAFSGERALHWLRVLTERAALSAHRSTDDATAELTALLARAAPGAEALRVPLTVPLAEAAHGAETALTAPGARVAGREAGAPWLVCAPLLLGGPGAPPWRPAADGSGLAVLLTLLECLVYAPPSHDVLALALPLSGARDDGLAAAEAYAARPLLALRGVLAVWRVGVPGLPLDVDARCLLLPSARALADALFRLGRTLGYPVWSGGAQSAFPGPHVPFLERGIPALPLCANADADAGIAADTLARCDAAVLQGAGDPLLRLLRGEQAV